MARHNSKDVILDAAEAVVIESGSSHMTMDAVAERSGISKGGLMYNFPTKEALLKGMIERMSTQFDQLREKARQVLKNTNYNELMVEILMMKWMTKKDDRLSAALLAVVANQPDLTDEVCAIHKERFFSKIVGNNDFVRSSLLFFAALGLHFSDLLHISPLNCEQKDTLFEAFLRHASGEKEI